MKRIRSHLARPITAVRPEPEGEEYDLCGPVQITKFEAKLIIGHWLGQIALKDHLWIDARTTSWRYERIAPCSTSATLALGW